MSKLRNPVGPESRGVYMRRRLIVLIGLLAVVGFVVLVILRPGVGEGAAKAPEVKVPDDLAASETADTEETTGLQSCAAGELAVTPLTDSNSYTASELPMLRLRVESRADVACQADLGTAGMAFVITSGSDEVWRSTDCQESGDNRLVLLQPGEALETEPIVWARERSKPDTCDGPRDQVGAGGATYHLHATIAGVKGTGTAAFLLY